MSKAALALFLLGIALVILCCVITIITSNNIKKVSNILTTKKPVVEEKKEEISYFHYVDLGKDAYYLHDAVRHTTGVAMYHSVKISDNPPDLNENMNDPEWLYRNYETIDIHLDAESGKWYTQVSRMATTHWGNGKMLMVDFEYIKDNVSFQCIIQEPNIKGENK